VEYPQTFIDHIGIKPGFSFGYLWEVARSKNRLKEKSHWWEIHTKTLRLEGDLPVTRWENFKTLIKSQFYLIGYVEDQWIWWHYFR
jgi:hypothetical protein